MGQGSHKHVSLNSQLQPQDKNNSIRFHLSEFWWNPLGLSFPGVDAVRVCYVWVVMVLEEKGGWKSKRSAAMGGDSVTGGFLRLGWVGERLGFRRQLNFCQSQLFSWTDAGKPQKAYLSDRLCVVPVSVYLYIYQKSRVILKVIDVCMSIYPNPPPVKVLSIFLTRKLDVISKGHILCHVNSLLLCSTRKSLVQCARTACSQSNRLNWIKNRLKTWQCHNRLTEFVWLTFYLRCIELG